MIQYLIIVFSASIPVINLAGIEALAVQVISAIFGALIAILTGILQFEKFHDKWLLFRRTAADLESEYYDWKNCVGDYKPDPQKEDPKDTYDKRLAMLVNKCEEILKDQTGEYIGYFRSSPGTSQTNTKP